MIQVTCEYFSALVALGVGAIFAAAFIRSTPRRGGVHVNDLSRWEQYGGTLKRPPPPGPSR